MRGERERQEVAKLYITAREGVIRYLVASGLDGDAAAEATQEAFLRLYTAKRDGGSDPGTVALWVYRVARNIAINTVKAVGTHEVGFV